MKYKDFEIITEGYPKVMLCWDYDENKASEELVLCEVPNRDFGFKCIDLDRDIIEYKNAKDLHSTKPRTIEDGLQYGDIIVKDNYKSTILSVHQDIIHKSLDVAYIESNNHTKCCGTAFTLSKLIEDGWTLKQEQSKPDIVELTIQDISDGKGKGIDPSLIRIKE